MTVGGRAFADATSEWSTEDFDGVACERCQSFLARRDSDLNGRISSQQSDNRRQTRKGIDGADVAREQGTVVDSGLGELPDCLA